MGIRFACPNGHNLNVKEDLAGRRGICPDCGAKFVIPVPSDTARPPASPQPVAESLRDSTTAVSERRPQAPPPLTGPAPGAAPPLAEPSIPPPPADAPPAAPVTLATDEPAPVLTEAATDTSRVARYVAQRRRSRQNQITLAVLLLVTVVILAVILLWVLQGAPTTGVVRPPDRPSIAQAGTAMNLPRPMQAQQREVRQSRE